MNRQDIPLVRTAQDLERKYNFKEMASNNEMVKQNAEDIQSLNTDLNNFVDITTQNIDDLQNQVDGNITSWFETGVPSLSTYPANEWLTDEEKNNHLGDLYYDKNTGYSYRFTLSNGVYSWIKLTDSDITEALSVANSAKDTADKKRRVFMEQPQPPYDNGDMWVKDKEIWICQISRQEGTYQNGDFINDLKYTDDTTANAVGDDLELTKGTVTTISDNVDELSRTMTTTVEAVSTNGQKIGTLETQQSETTQTVNEISTKVDNMVVPVKEVNGTGNVILTNSSNTELGTLKIKGDMSLLFGNDGQQYGIHQTFNNDLTFNNNLYFTSGVPTADTLYPSNNLFGKNMNLIIEYTEADKEIFQLPYTYLNYISQEVCDEFVLDNNKAKIIRNVGINSNHEKYRLNEPIIEELGDYSILLKYGSPKIYLQCFDSALYNATYLTRNELTDKFATKVELHSEITQTADEINLEVSKKAGKDEIISTINQSPEQITLSSNRLVVDSTNFKLDQQGNVDMSGKLSLNDGKMVFDGNRGLMTNLQYVSSNRLEFLGVDADEVLEINEYHPRYVNENIELCINAEIPDNFEITEAKLQLIISPILWYVDGENVWGYVRNISAFKTDNLNELYWQMDAWSDVMNYENNAILSEMTGSFGADGYTQPEPTIQSHPVQNVYSNDISSSLQSGWNRIIIKGRTDAPYYNGSDIGTEAGWGKNSKLCYERTANCIAVLNIIGYTKFE